jgi:hypothetical protein
MGCKAVACSSRYEMLQLMRPYLGACCTAFPGDGATHRGNRCNSSTNAILMEAIATPKSGCIVSALAGESQHEDKQRCVSGMLLQGGWVAAAEQRPSQPASQSEHSPLVSTSKLPYGESIDVRQKQQTESSSPGTRKE